MVNVLSTAFLILPTTVISRAGRGAYLSVGLAALFTLPIAWIFGTLTERYPGQSAHSLFSSLLGKRLGNILALGYVGFLLISNIGILDRGGELIHLYFLPETPSLVIHLALSSLAGYAAALGLESMSRFNVIVFPALLISVISLGLINARYFNIDHLLPVLDKGWSGILGGATPLVGHLSQIAFLLVLSPGIQGTQRRRSATWAVILTALVLEIIFIFVLLVLGPELSTYYFFPTFQLARIFSIGNNLRGLDALIMTVWITTVSLKAALWFYAAIVLLGDVFRLQNRKAILAPLVILETLFVVAGIDNIQESAYFGASIYAPMALATFQGVIPLLLLVLSTYKRRTRDNSRQRGK